MSIFLTTDNFTDYKQVNTIDNLNNNNNNNIILNNNLILESDFINNANIALKGSIIFNGGKLINRGNIYLVQKKFIEYTLPFDINGDFQKTGLIIEKDVYNFIIISKTITGPNNNSVKWEKKFNFELGKNNAFYFSNDGGVTAKDKIQVGSELYWNESYSKLKIYKDWKIILQIL
jgi:hypothetical protein